eukprot:14035056-Ditylum_brightwellii.AAC.1
MVVEILIHKEICCQLKKEEVNKLVYKQGILPKDTKGKVEISISKPKTAKKPTSKPADELMDDPDPINEPVNKPTDEPVAESTGHKGRENKEQ